MKDNKDLKLAVLIDADNIPYSNVKGMLNEIAKFGIPTIKRIYGDWTKPTVSGWKSSLLENAITPIQQYSYTTGKNATDSAMIIDAMDILYSGKVDGFCIVSSDSDFTRLAARLRESGMIVVGMGERKTPKSFISACNRFKYLDILAAAEQQPAREPEASAAKSEKAASKPTAEKSASAKMERTDSKPAPPTRIEEVQPQTDLTTIRSALRTIVAENSDEDDWILIARIGNLLGKRYPDFDVRNFGFSKLTPFLESLDLFHVKTRPAINGNGKLIYVKLK